MKKRTKRSLSSFLRGAAAETNDAADDEIIEVEVEETETDVEDQSDEDEVVDDDDASASAEEETDEETDEDEETGPTAKAVKSVRIAATKKERARCIAIISHANADANPKFAAHLLSDGTSKARAVSLLNTVSAGNDQTGSLASRMNAAQKGKGPGQDRPVTKGDKATSGQQLVANASTTFGRNKSRQK